MKKKKSTSAAIEFPHHMSFNAVSSSTITSDCSLSNNKEPKQSQRIAASQEEYDDDGEAGEHKKTVKIYLKHRQMDGKVEPKKSVFESTVRDRTRIQTLHKRVIEKKNQNVISRLNNNKKHSDQHLKPVVEENSSTRLTCSWGSCPACGNIGVQCKPWVGRCVPCYDCFEQNGPYYDPNELSPYRNVSCKDPRCHLVSSPDPPQVCKAENQTCPYYYWYGDSCNTTGDFALETFTVNLTSPTGNSEFRPVKNVMFRCGHWNRGLFHGAAGLLGLGRGPLSFASQLQSLYGHSFSYCLVDRDSDTNRRHGSYQTGTILDSGTTLSYFADPTYQIMKEAFVNKTKGYQVMKNLPLLDPCYNVSGVENVELPEFGIQFADGAVWNLPVENYFLLLEEDVVCLAILGTPRSGLSIIGNYQQQNIHILYDTNKSRLGYAPIKCADV
ncbi:hypothetical protein F3Y22_tig00112738pilonHSYRG00462 [Hibiscus syriacus]|uniref:Peptidase A1 domain-containing protein n=1 Tax=Hibiscus syriacus TaxID=106335 RepID=A0A6A2Y0B7_HIBSY|nr:hypothetical protein F3Y22_tig00112738pilonHSYRG00462 [Hibiscus syriacus]